MYKAHGVAVERGSIMAAFGCNFEGDIPVSRVVALVGKFSMWRRSTASR
jgi:hydroxymethylglutaryl-CoA lyase